VTITIEAGCGALMGTLVVAHISMAVASTLAKSTLTLLDIMASNIE
jgi:hypothetical protein